MQESYENFFHENFAKDRDTLIEQTILQIIQKIYTKIFCMKFLNEHKANYGKFF